MSALRTIVVVLAALLLAPAAAGAATRFVSPTGPAEGACSRTAPCAIDWALSGGGSATGDTVMVARGTYPDAALVIARPLTVTAAPDQPRPVLRSSAPGGSALTVAEGAGGTVVEHLAVRATGEGATGVDLRDVAAVDDITVSSRSAPCLHSAAPGVRIDESTFTRTGAGSAPCLETTGSDTSWTGVTVTALNVETAAAYSGDGTIADGTFTGQSVGLRLGGNPSVHRVTAAGRDRGVLLSGTTTLTDSVAIARAGGSGVFAASGTHELLNVTAWGDGNGAFGIRAVNGAQVTVKNSIARGTFSDVVADAATATIGPDCTVVTGCPAGRMLVDHSNFRSGPGVDDMGANQSGAPLFADPGFDDFHLRKGSPAIDAGSFEFNSGSADRDGRFRWLGASPDMGAYEFPAPRPAPPKADRKPPTLGVVRLTATRFRATRAGMAFSAAAVPAGTTLVFVVSEDADLVAQVTRVGAKRSLGTIVRAASRGTHRVPLSGRLDGRALRPGRYVLTVMARDVAQNLSRPRRLPFTIAG
ncbi:MAG: hypothetical protein JWM73_2927 [Solirubrobacterales bacterium]|nr:hypothetical protein [Solirubrobacterales bacterium]